MRDGPVGHDPYGNRGPRVQEDVEHSVRGSGPAKEEWHRLPTMRRRNPKCRNPRMSLRLGKRERCIPEFLRRFVLFPFSFHSFVSWILTQTHREMPLEVYDSGKACEGSWGMEKFSSAKAAIMPCHQASYGDNNWSSCQRQRSSRQNQEGNRACTGNAYLG